MKLITEQAEMLKEDLERYGAERQGLLNQKNNKTNAGQAQAGQSQGEVGQLTTLEMVQRIAAISKKMEELKQILETAEIIGNPNTDQVQIGSKFTVGICFGDNEIELMEGTTLIEKRVSNEKPPAYITAKSDLGVAIFGKEVGEIFYYLLESGTMAIGTVMDIQKAPKTKDPQAVKK